MVKSLTLWSNAWILLITVLFNRDERDRDHRDSDYRDKDRRDRDHRDKDRKRSDAPVVSRHPNITSQK